MFIVYLRLVAVRMAIDAAEYLIIAGIGMAVGTKCPFPGMMSGINRKILAIMVERGRAPCDRGMA